jgi:alkylation response protein AidB-like acyl-CoA dehydrogenase
VDFDLTDEQEMLRATARQFVADVCPAERAKEWDEESAVPPELFKGMADLGWFSLPFAETDGGDGGGPVELILIAEELGRADVRDELARRGPKHLLLLGKAEVHSLPPEGLRYIVNLLFYISY